MKNMNIAIIFAGGIGTRMHALIAAKSFVDGRKDIVLIHDGVRPLITCKTIHDNIQSVKRNGSAITCVPATETVLEVTKDNKIANIPDRNETRMARAPQSFFLNDILEAHNLALKDGLTSFIDSCSMMRHYEHSLYLVEGPSINIKVTTPQDFYVMRALLDERENNQIYGELDE